MSSLYFFKLVGASHLVPFQDLQHEKISVFYFFIFCLCFLLYHLPALFLCFLCHVAQTNLGYDVALESQHIILIGV